MGFLHAGEWRDDTFVKPEENDGKFVRKDASFRNALGDDDYPAEVGRYRLYVSLACPWAHRTLIVRKLKHLEDAIDVVVVDALMHERGWILPDGDPLYTLYLKAAPDYSGRVTVPVLWDKATSTIVSNESSEIIRMLDTEFDELVPAAAGVPTLYPQELRTSIDAVNERVYATLNNGVYRCGFAATQSAYDEAVAELFATMDFLEERLAEQRYLAGSRFTEADVRLFTTLVRFDPVYNFHFKCNLRRLRDYSNLWAYTRDIYQMPGIADTVDIPHIKRHYFGSHRSVNPRLIVPVGPEIDYTEPHDRAGLV